MKNKKSLSVIILALVSMLFLSCGKNNPKSVTKDYLDTIMKGDFVNAYTYIAESEKSLLNYDEFIKNSIEEIGELSIIIDYIMDHTSYSITSSSIDGDKATVTYDITSIDVEDEKFQEVFIEAFFSSMGTDDKREISQMIKEKLETIEVPLTTKEDKLNLVKEEGNWKVSLR